MITVIQHEFHTRFVLLLKLLKVPVVSMHKFLKMKALMLYTEQKMNGALATKCLISATSSAADVALNTKSLSRKVIRLSGVCLLPGRIRSKTQ